MKRGYIRYLSLAMGLLACSQISISSAAIYPGTNIVWNPGHYWAIHKDAVLGSKYTQDRIRPMKGVNKPYTWKYLEKSKGVYDFSQIENDLALMNAQGKKLMIYVFDKSFFNRETAIPNYLINPSNPQYDPAYKGGQTLNKTGGYNPKKWVPAVNVRFQALHAALAARFNGRIEGIQLMETATSLTGTLIPADFSNAAYAASVISNIHALRSYFPRTVVQQMFNGMPGTYIESVFAAARASRVGMSTVDTNPLDARQWDKYYRLFMGHSNGLYGSVGAMVVNANFKIGTSNEISVATMANFGINKLGANYMFWSSIKAAKIQEIHNNFSKYRTVLQ